MATFVCFMVTFSAATDGYSIGMIGNIIANPGFVQQFGLGDSAVALDVWFTIGQFFAPVALQVMSQTDKMDFRTPIYTQWSQVGLMILIYVFPPESPAWCVSRGYEARAKNALKQLHYHLLPVYCRSAAELDELFESRIPAWKFHKTVTATQRLISRGQPALNEWGDRILGAIDALKHGRGSEETLRSDSIGLTTAALQGTIHHGFSAAADLGRGPIPIEGPTVITNFESILAWNAFSEHIDAIAVFLRSVGESSTTSRGPHTTGGDSASCGVRDLLGLLDTFKTYILPGPPVLDTAQLHRSISLVGEYGLPWSADACLLLLIAALASNKLRCEIRPSTSPSIYNPEERDPEPGYVLENGNHHNGRLGSAANIAFSLPYIWLSVLRIRQRAVQLAKDLHANMSLHEIAIPS
ncbi:hypothetical protein BJY00DRAFT_307814 [Aspergillus carlsbadensis]|nr:hypothetical protein BJY00DRAFT_307814 [Aspergillus carlsbadensis]